ncbi:hypothetical protein AALA90_07295 [Lachnospiraceae bacterium 38-10]
MRKDHKKCGRFLAAALCGAVLTGMAPGLVVQAAPEMAMQLRTKGIEDPVVTAKSWEGDYVVYSDCYAWQDSTQTADPLPLVPPVLYRVTDAYRYDRGVRKRVMDLQSVTDGSMNMVDLKNIAFISAAVGGKDSAFENGNGIRPVYEKEVDAWKLTIKNPYDEKTNPNGMREPEISNIRRDGGAVCFDYKELYSTGNCYLSAVLLTEHNREIVGYDRLVDATVRGVGTIAINWPSEYDKEGYILKVFAEKYNGDNMTDYISEMQFVYQGAAIDRED